VETVSQATRISFDLESILKAERTFKKGLENTFASVVLLCFFFIYFGGF
jgi:hypothetical protein